MNILFTLNEGYQEPLEVLIASLVDQQPSTLFHFHIFYDPSSFSQAGRIRLEKYISQMGQLVVWYNCEDWFRDERTLRYYPVEMYYRLIAPFILPEDMDRILYLDPDIVAVRPFLDFYEQDFQGNLFVATSHNYASKWLQPINNLRLRTRKADRYFNTGIILMNLPSIRQNFSLTDIRRAVDEFREVLVLPDQDVFNHLYWDVTLEADWQKYNVDPRVVDRLERLFPKNQIIKRIKEQATFIHYCGKRKPWKERDKYKYSLGSYYFHFEQKKQEFQTEGETLNEGI